MAAESATASTTTAEYAYVFHEGDTVIVRHLPDTSPAMVVKKKIMGERKKGHEVKRVLEFLVCFWFSTDGKYQEQQFNYLDMEVSKRACAPLTSAAQ
jgi:hypothetical protein